MPVDLIAESEAFKGGDDGIYPDNWQTVSIFADIVTQWRSGPGGGVIGLDYGPLFEVMRIRRVAPEDEADIFDGIKVMERAAKRSINDRR